MIVYISCTDGQIRGCQGRDTQSHLIIAVFLELPVCGLGLDLQPPFLIQVYAEPVEKRIAILAEPFPGKNIKTMLHVVPQERHVRACKPHRLRFAVLHSITHCIKGLSRAKRESKIPIIPGQHTIRDAGGGHIIPPFFKDRHTRSEGSAGRNITPGKIPVYTGAPVPVVSETLHRKGAEQQAVAVEI